MQRERGREGKENETVRGAKRTPGKRKAWIVTERAAAGLVIINSEKRVAVKARLPRCLRCMRYASVYMRARERGF